jgi:uncharacterized membrane protein (UPF0127 family)
VRVRNTTRGTVLGDRIDIADTAAKRNQGLLKRTSLEAGEGLWIVPSQAIHMFGMKIPLDIVFLTKDKRVRKVSPNLGKWRISVSLPAHSVLELPVGQIEASGTQVGDQLEFDK